MDRNYLLVILNCDLRFALRLMNRTACKFYIIIIIIIIIDKFRNLKNILRSYS